MELRKRSLQQNSERFDDESPSKRRRRCPLNLHPRSSISARVTGIEDLCGELWFEIFSYFDGHHLAHSFFHLNSSIDSLLSDYRLPIHLNISAQNESLPSPFDPDQIVSLHLHCSHIDVQSLFDKHSFARLRSLSLSHINEEQLELLSQMPWQDLRQVSIQSRLTKDILKMTQLYFPRVQRMVLDSLGKEFLVKPSEHSISGNRLESLTLDGRIKLAKLFRLWPWVPRLRSLSLLSGGVHQCDYWLDEKLIARQNFPPDLSSMHVTICDDDMSFANLERLVPKTIRSLSIAGCMADDDLDDYLSSANWQRLMSSCSNTLRRIQLDFSSYFDPGDACGLQKTLLKFRRDSFFRNAMIQSRNFFITVQGSIEPVISQ